MRISPNPFAFALALLFTVSGGAWAQSGEEGKPLAGKYYVETLYSLKDSIDTIEFLPKGKCLVTLGDKADPVSGSFHGITDGMLTIEFGDPKTVFSFKAALVKRVLTLTDDGGVESYFAQQPEAPWPKAEDLLGTYFVRHETDDGVEEVVYTRTADHLTKGMFRLLSKIDHTYRKFHVTAKWTYADGISTYTLTESDLPEDERWIYNRDFITKRDAKGIWSMDTATGDYLCEVPTEKLELPPPPAGSQKAP